MSRFRGKIAILKGGYSDEREISLKTGENVEKALEEMRKRLQGILSGKQEGIHLSTFHSLGVSLLRNSIHHLGYR